MSSLFLLLIILQQHVVFLKKKFCIEPYVPTQRTLEEPK